MSKEGQNRGIKKRRALKSQSSLFLRLVFACFILAGPTGLEPATSGLTGQENIDKNGVK